ncbi:SusD/RagB family nutrient-binding outer membrane lipoprotein [Arenibacter sp. F26102]|uniref:SusD/RagB family nutrient-binding outer membrane lipoprotein n=1 Tax=Arenibacter sp. F26102 TaxID=2926416 RepID=UPI001FF1ABCC|nr:SusD/RagB family nutrient-binding outer membrane lipoprotein [Arenibacter sp. F26102]MCK0147984.1 SusD/RagB family nutrient-binding outer membrane lipoprotein [Arenibacter sp. F26102]
MKKLAILITAVIFASCSSDLESLNENIKDPLAVPGESLFTGAQKSLVDQVVDLNVNNNNTKLWAQYLQETTYTDESNYDQVTRTIPATHWSILYKDVLKDLDEAKIVIEATTYSTPELEALKPNKLVIIEILNVYAYSILVETFGDVPYTEALDIDNLLPKYDDGETVYKDLIGRLTAAISALDESNESFGTADRIYGGDVAKWKKFAASLKLRMGIVLSDVDAAFAKTTVESAVAAGVFTSNEDNAAYEYLGSDPNTNPIYDNLVLSGRKDFVAGMTIIDIMQPRSYEYLEDSNEDGVINDEDDPTVVPGSVSSTDPRMKYYFASNIDADPSVEQVVYFGGEIGNLANYSSHTHVNAQMEEATFPGIILDYSEVELLLAEARARLFEVGGTAKEHYDAGITASILDWGGTEDEATTYLSQPNVDYDLAILASTATTPWKEVIGTQKWIALYNRGLEAWTSIRLLDYPLMATPVEAVSGFPNRYTYPIIEQSLNGANYGTASSAIGGDEAETKLFWDLN